MHKKTSFSLIFIVLILIWGCSSNNQSEKIQAGYYQISKIEPQTTHTGNFSTPKKLGIENGFLHIINSDSLEFVGQNTLGDLLWGQSQFNYKLRGKRIILTNGDFKRKMKFEITSDELLKLKTNTEDMNYTYFVPVSEKLSGEYKVYGFITKKGALDSEILAFAREVFNNESFNFVSGNNVIIQPKLAQFITGSNVSTDTVFSYKTIDNEITFSNTSHSVTIPFVFDGKFQLSIDDKNFERIDIDEIKG